MPCVTCTGSVETCKEPQTSQTKYVIACSKLLHLLILLNEVFCIIYIGTFKRKWKIAPYLSTGIASSRYECVLDNVSHKRVGVALPGTVETLYEK